MGAMRPDTGLAEAIGVVRQANRYFERRQPWALAQNGATAELGTVLYTAAETLRIVSGLLAPVMPGKMRELRACLGLTGAPPDAARLKSWGELAAGTTIGAMHSLFPRIVSGHGRDEGAGSAAPAAATASPTPPATVAGPQIEYADFEKIALRTAKIITAQKIEGADKLLRLEIEVGAQRRQIVAGIAQHYQPEDLPGRIIVIVANLKPAKIRGVESDGMLLAASGGGALRLLTVDGETPSGSAVR